MGLKRYLVVKDSGGVPLGSSDINVRMVNGQQALARYTFAPPPAGVSTIDVQAADWPTLTGISVQR